MIVQIINKRPCKQIWALCVTLVDPLVVYAVEGEGVEGSNKIK